MARLVPRRRFASLSPRRRQHGRGPSDRRESETGAGAGVRVSGEQGTSNANGSALVHVGDRPMGRSQNPNIARQVSRSNASRWRKS